MNINYVKLILLIIAIITLFVSIVILELYSPEDDQGDTVPPWWYWVFLFVSLSCFLAAILLEFQSPYSAGKSKKIEKERPIEVPKETIENEPETKLTYLA
jgi:H+/Cl- antiporter ClcA